MPHAQHTGICHDPRRVRTPHHDLQRCQHWRCRLPLAQNRRITGARAGATLSLPPGRYRLRNLWQGRNIGSATALRVRLAAHGTVLYRLWH